MPKKGWQLNHRRRMPCYGIALVLVLSWAALTFPPSVYPETLEPLQPALDSPRGASNLQLQGIHPPACLPNLAIRRPRPRTGRFFQQGALLWSGFVGVTGNTPLGWGRIAQWTVETYQSDRRASLSGWTFGHIEARQTTPGFVFGPVWGFRRQVWQNQRWSTFFVTTLGPVWHQHPVTPESLRFNFDIQGGFGVTRRIGRSLLLQAGCRWYHLSNARMRGKEANLGFDSPLWFFGLIGR